MIPSWAIKLLAGLVLLAGAWFHGYRHGTVAVRTKWDAEKAQQLAAANAEFNGRTKRLQENADAAELKRRQAEADARGLRDQRDSLLHAATGAGQRACAAAAAGGPAASDPDVVPADLFRSVEERAEQLAGTADAARIAGQLCESAYGSLTAPR